MLPLLLVGLRLNHQPAQVLRGAVLRRGRQREQQGPHECERNREFSKVHDRISAETGRLSVRVAWGDRQSTEPESMGDETVGNAAAAGNVTACNKSRPLT